MSELTVKLRGRTTTPQGAEGAKFLSARGAKPQAHHGPLQRLLERNTTTQLPDYYDAGPRHQRIHSDTEEDLCNSNCCEAGASHPKRVLHEWSRKNGAGEQEDKGHTP